MQSPRYTNASPAEQAEMRSAYYARLSPYELDHQVNAAINRTENDIARLTRLRDDLARAGITHKVELVEERIRTATFFGEWSIQLAQQPVVAQPELPVPQPAAPQPVVTGQQMTNNGRLDRFAGEIADTEAVDEVRYNASRAFNPATLGVRDVLEPYIPQDLRQLDAWR